MRKIVAWTLVLLAVNSPLRSQAFPAEAVRSQITSMPLGTNIELRFKDKQKLRGARGAVSDFGFTLVDARAGERQIAFDDVTSVKPVSIKAHTARNILIGVGITVAAVGIWFAVMLHETGYL